jgi:hypothetical protein
MEEITALLDRDRKVLMDWSPKSGCTIAVKMFFKQMGLLETALAHHVWVHEYRMHIFSKAQPTTIKDLYDADLFKFKVVRNPYSRVVSAYIHAMRKEVMHPPIKKALHRWSANISFKRFVDYLGKIDLQQCDPHYALQQHFFERDQQFKFDRIVKLEQLEEEVARLNQLKGFNFDLQGVTSHHHIEKNKALNTNVAKKKWSKIQNDIPPYPFFYTDALRTKVEQLYRADLKAYNYSFNELLQE